jgi:hypothetical protein
MHTVLYTRGYSRFDQSGKKDHEVQDNEAELPASECNFDTVSATPIHVIVRDLYLLLFLL